MNLDKYISMPNCTMPEEIIHKLNKGITPTQFLDKNIILEDEKLFYECGYTKMQDNSYLVSMYTNMPNVTKEMIDWWFWWHPQENKRYMAWYPNEHKSISYAKKDSAYFKQKTVPNFKANTQYPIEKVGKLYLPLCIDFIDPLDFGFTKKAIDENNVSTIVCGHVSAFKGLIKNTEMAHIFIKQEKGLLLVSRFWLGINIKNEIIKKLFITEEQAKSMAEHCCIEYRNFNIRIPLIYNEWLEEIKE